ncbi:MAG: Type 1 glutamine amidotransferase-like domain-containing protein [Patescibacteria group bacterium]
MNIKTKNIFLAGGGSVDDSRVIDKRFTATVDTKKPLVYVPNAIKSRPYEKGLLWLKAAMLPFGVTDIEMLDVNQSSYPQITSVAGIYIGGGDSVKLLQEIKKSGFDNYLLEIIAAGLPVYGGSAGAIILGEDIRTAPEARSLNPEETIGLKMVYNFSVFCHYVSNKKMEVQKLSHLLGHGIIAIPEKSGGHLCDNHLVNYGTEAIVIFHRNEIFQLKPNQGMDVLSAI